MLKVPFLCAVPPMLAALSAPAAAHSLLISRGEAVIYEDRISFELEVAAEDLLHWYGLDADAEGRFSYALLDDAADRHAAALEQVLLLRDSQGHRLRGGPFLVQKEWPTDDDVDLDGLRRFMLMYTSDFRVDPVPEGSLEPRDRQSKLRWVTFQIDMAASGVGVWWQVVLLVRGQENDPGAVVRLTSRGNAETIEVRWESGRGTVQNGAHASPTAPQCERCRDRGSLRFHEICVDIDLAQGTIEARIWLPLSILATWLTLPSGDGEFLDLKDAAFPKAAQSLMADALRVEIDGNAALAENNGIAFVMPDAAESTGHSSPVSLWTGFLSVEMRFPATGTYDRVNLQWNLFNPVVLSAHAVLHGGGTCTDTSVSTYQPRHEWRREQ